MLNVTKLSLTNFFQLHVTNSFILKLVLFSVCLSAGGSRTKGRGGRYFHRLSVSFILSGNRESFNKYV